MRQRQQFWESSAPFADFLRVYHTQMHQMDATALALLTGVCAGTLVLMLTHLHLVLDTLLAGL